ncbi:MAG: hypothetical protein ACYCOU_04120 [Sulfobacillus sp.]
MGPVMRDNVARALTKSGWDCRSRRRICADEMEEFCYRVKKYFLGDYHWTRDIAGWSTMRVELRAQRPLAGEHNVFKLGKFYLVVSGATGIRLTTPPDDDDDTELP